MIVNTMNTHAPLSKDLRAAAALRCTTTGHLAAVHGVSHIERTVVALVLCERWNGSGALSPADAEFYDKLLEVAALDNELLAWWCMFVGRAAACLGELYPAGVISKERSLRNSSTWTESGEIDMVFELPCAQDRAPEKGQTVEAQSQVSESVLKALRKLSKCGKKKNWHGGRGFKIHMSVQVKGRSIDLDKVLDEGEDY